MKFIGSTMCEYREPKYKGEKFVTSKEQNYWNLVKLKTVNIVFLDEEKDPVIYQVQ